MSDFYLRYFIGHRSRFGNEFMEIELRKDGQLRYANNSKYKGDVMIRKEVTVSAAVVAEVQRIVEESGVLDADDEKWPEPGDEGRQELEIALRTKDRADHISFACGEIGSLLDVNKSEDPETLRSFYYLVQDLKSLVFSLITAHFKIKPIP